MQEPFYCYQLNLKDKINFASHCSFTYYNGIVGNTDVADGALILHMIT